MNEFEFVDFELNLLKSELLEYAYEDGHICMEEKADVDEYVREIEGAIQSKKVAAIKADKILVEVIKDIFEKLLFNKKVSNHGYIVVNRWLERYDNKYKKK